MQIALESEIYQWLVSLNIIRSEKPPATNEQGRFVLDEHQTSLFENGKKIGEVLCILAQEHGIESKDIHIDKFKDSSTPACRLYNWNIIGDGLKKIGIPLDADIKSLIVAGDIQLVAELLKDIYEQEIKSFDQISVASSGKSKNMVSAAQIRRIAFVPTTPRTSYGYPPLLPVHQSKQRLSPLCWQAQGRESVY